MEIFDNLLMTLALGGLAVSGLLFASALIYPYLRSAWDKATALARAVFCGAVVVACLFGGAKGKITYPKTDTDVAYLTDAGSYVTNDAVHVAFTRVPTVPDTATFYLDYCALDGTNAQGVATNWVTAKTATFGELSVPFDFAFAAATNYNWMAYTDWTPGPAVQTNGVWHAYWGLDRKQGRYFIPVRTCVRDGGEVIATPKSKWDAEKSPNAYVQDGLIAMWDGEWNVGRGKHDPNATVWVDLTGNGYDLQQEAAQNNGYTWKDKCIVGNPESGYWCHALSDEEIETFKTTTLELCAKKSVASNPSNGRGVVRTPYASLAWYNSFENSMQTYKETHPKGMTVSEYPTKFSLLDRNTFSLLTDDDLVVQSWRLFCNGEEFKVRADAWHDLNYIPMNALRVGVQSIAKTKNDGQVTIWNVRIYNRELTAAEVAHNYAVDKARFGSGNE